MEPLAWQWKAEDDASESAWDERAISAGAMSLEQHLEDGQLSLAKLNESEMDSTTSPDGSMYADRRMGIGQKTECSGAFLCGLRLSFDQ